MIRSRPPPALTVPDVVGVVEALAGQAEDALLSDQLLNELEVGAEAGEAAAVDLDHHVHGPLRHDGHQAGDAPQHPEGELRVALDDGDGVVEEGLGGVGEDGGEGALDEGVGADNPLGHAEQALADLLVEDVAAVVDDDPAHPPAGHEEPLGEAAAGQHRHRGGERGDRHVRLAREHEVIVDLVG